MIITVWKYSGLEKIRKIAQKFNIDLEFNLRGGGVGRFKYSECYGLAETKACFRIEFSVQAKHKDKIPKKHDDIKENPFGVSATGGCDFCVNLCNGELTAECSLSYSVNAQFGSGKFNRTYGIGDSFNLKPYQFGKVNSLALLEPYCNRSPNPNSCCCQKKQ